MVKLTCFSSPKGRSLDIARSKSRSDRRTTLLRGLSMQHCGVARYILPWRHSGPKSDSAIYALGRVLLNPVCFCMHLRWMFLFSPSNYARQSTLSVYFPTSSVWQHHQADHQSAEVLQPTANQNANSPSRFSVFGRLEIPHYQSTNPSSLSPMPPR